jgi:hypothetical protein
MQGTYQKKVDNDCLSQARKSALVAKFGKFLRENKFGKSAFSGRLS